MTAVASTQVRTMRFQSAANRIVRGLLHVPLLGRLAGRRLLIVYVVGRKTGTRYAVPVAYTARDDDLLVGTSFGWARNLRSGDQVDILLRGRRRCADVAVVTDEAGVVADYGVIARDNHQFARFNAIALDSSGEPDSTDLHRSWEQGARVLRLTPS